MAKKPERPLINSWIKRIKLWPVQLEKAVMTPEKPERTDRQAFVWDEYSPEEGLEDTPAEPAQSTVPAPVKITAEPSQPAAPASRAEVMAVRAEHRVNNTTEKRASGKHRASSSNGFAHKANDISRVLTVEQKRSKTNADALEFADNPKRLGRKGRRNRKIMAYLGSALAVTVVLLLVFLVPSGAVADAPESVSVSNGTVAISPSDSTSVKGNAIYIDNASETYSATASPTPSPTPIPTPIPTTEPDPTENSIDMDDLVEDFVVVADQYYTDYHYSPNHYEYTEGEVYILAQLIHGEARGEIWEGKIAVANVVMNRVLCRGAFPDTIKGVVTDPDQFSGYKPTTKPSRECIKAAREVLENELWVIPQDVYYFRSGAPANVNWGRLPFYKKIDGHCFYRQKLRGRMQGGGVPPAMFERVYKYAQLGCKPEDRVYRIQFMLDALGYDIEKVDSRFGDDTEKALIKFQQDHGLEGDGMAGPATVRKLIEEYGTRDYFVKFCI